MLLRSTLIFFAFISYSKCRAIDDDTARNLDSSTKSSDFFGDLKNMYRVYEECNAKELSTCLKMKLIHAIERLSRKIDVPIIDGAVSLVKNEKDVNEDQDNEVFEAALPRSIVEKESKLNEIIIDKTVNFFAGRSLQFKLNNIFKDIRRSFQGEVEGKFLPTNESSG